jgi:ApaG protein
VKEQSYEAETRGLIVRVRPHYLPEQSDPDGHKWVWAYRVEIVNASAETVQLVSRRWVITDALGKIELVEGPGVVGQTPTLRPGDSYSYASGCPLTTSSGSMVGTYRMVTDLGQEFDIAIPAFSLDLPDARRVVN